MKSRKRILLLILLLLLIGGLLGVGSGFFTDADRAKSTGSAVKDTSEADSNTNQGHQSRRSEEKRQSEKGSNRSSESMANPKKSDSDPAEVGEDEGPKKEPAPAQEDRPAEVYDFIIEVYTPKGAGDSPTITFGKELHSDATMSFEGKFVRRNEHWLRAKGKLTVAGPKVRARSFPVTLMNSGTKTCQGVYGFRPSMAEEGLCLFMAATRVLKGRVTILGSDKPFPGASVRLRARQDVSYLYEYDNWWLEDCGIDKDLHRFPLVESGIEMAWPDDESIYWGDSYQKPITVPCAEDGSFEVRSIEGEFAIEALYPNGQSLEELEYRVIRSEWSEPYYQDEEEYEEEAPRVGSIRFTHRLEEYEEEYEHPPLNIALPIVSTLRFQIDPLSDAPIDLRLIEAGSTENGFEVYDIEEVQSLYADKNGVVEYVGLTKGIAEVFIRPAGFLGRTFPIEYEEGKTTDLGKIEFSRGVTLEGRVEDIAGIGLHGVTLFCAQGDEFYNLKRIYGPDAEAKGAAVPVGVTRWRSDHGGKFSISGLAIGEISILALAEGFPRQLFQVSITDKETQPPETLVLRRSADLRVHVKFAKSMSAEEEKPLRKGIWVSLYAGERLFDSTPHEERGKDSFAFRDVPAGEYQVSASAGGLKSPRIPITLVAGQISEITLTIPEPATIFGKLIGRDGAPLVGETISISYSKEATSDALGNYRFENVAPGEYFLRLANEDDRNDTLFLRERFVYATSGAEIEKDIDLRKNLGVTIRGRVTFNGKAVYTTGWLQPIGASDSAHKIPFSVAADGSFHARGAQAGEYILVCKDGEYEWESKFCASLPLVVKRAEGLVEIEHDFNGRAIRGKVDLPPCAEYALVRLRSLAADSHYLPYRAAVTEASGSYYLPRVPFGKYRLVAECKGFAPQEIIINHQGQTTQGFKFSQATTSFSLTLRSPVYDSSFSSRSPVSIHDQEGKEVPYMIELITYRVGVTRLAIDGLVPGSYLLKIEDGALEASEHEIKVTGKEGQVIALDLVCKAALQLTISGPDLSGLDLVGASYSLTNLDSGVKTPFIQESYDRERQVECTGIEKGRYRLDVKVPGYQPYSQTIQFDRSQFRYEKITLKKR